VDYSTPDLTAHRRPANFGFPVHHTLLGAGVLIAEHMTNLSGLAGRRAEVMFLAINIAGSDGAPARVVARPID
jgi:kynurenine formamidase